MERVSKPELMLGIDLGTSKCLAGLSIDGKVYWIPAGDEYASVLALQQNQVDGRAFLPSVYCYGTDGSRPPKPAREYLGQLAIHYQGMNPGRVVRNSKRFMHRHYSSKGNDELTWAFHVESGSVTRKRPGDIAGAFIKHILTRAESGLENLARDGRKIWDWGDGQIRRAVITVPACFNEDQRRATKKHAAEIIAGLTEVELLEEPIAAAIGLGLHLNEGQHQREDRKSKLILIIDVGAGTTDLSLLKVGGGTRGLCEIGRIGDNNLGALNWDVEIARLLLTKGLADNPTQLDQRLQDLDLSHDWKNERYGFDRAGEILTKAEEAKRRLCDGRTPEFQVSWAEGGRDLKVLINRRDMEQATEHLAEWIGQLCQSLLDSVNLVRRKENGKWYQRFGWACQTPLEWEHLDEVYLVGGGARIPQVVRAVKKILTPRYVSRLKISRKPEILVARGAAIYAEMFAQGKGADAISERRLPHDIGVTSHVLETTDNVRCEDLASQGIQFFDLIPANASLPREVSDRTRTGTREFPLSHPESPTVQLQLWERSVSINYPDGLLKPRGLIRFDGTEPRWRSVWYWRGRPQNLTLTLELVLDDSLKARIKYGTQQHEVLIQEEM